ncbi:salicylate hydroxylase [Pararhizobium capsulatum DSM 1112]|uniref:Salicylate hydroxylase n=1 Tax=Pararhizobium capsulatum DSM 1112 TaxID=1121113 RepID=A0ABU0BRN2_9HYPH|nr:FAD-dependent monooxygenase [Pararhizobium capsulatum]MDQ0320150.1 salicylate hydroxylase [Pararhizobium capsulatum DSM 1112]
MAETGPIMIAGAGIAGLTAALSLARKGFTVAIFDQAQALSEIGAGLQLSPNATRILDKLGLLPALETVWRLPESVSLADGRSLRTIATVPCGRFARERWGAPYAVLHRGDLQRVLLDAVKAEPLCTLRMGETVDAGRPPEGYRLLLGADGVWSKTRKRLETAGISKFSGNIAWRMTLREADLPGSLDARRVTAFLGSGAHLVAYPLTASRFNLVAISKGAAENENWATNVTDRDELAHALSGWHPDLRGLVLNAPEITRWPLHEVTEGSWHHSGHTILIGDAAHAMMPFAAQGAAMAIEDAFELAHFLSEISDQQAALAAFSQHRRPRIARVRSRGAFNRFAYHAAGPFRLGRDIMLSLRRPENLAADFDWLYGYQPQD